jgi:ADP-dependent NAD(P)H-hydrate dehydratase / NAD(P)H-hydrate epimerase
MQNKVRINNYTFKIPHPDQVSALDQQTIESEPIGSINLMERASNVFCNWFEKKFPDRETPLTVICGPGNNGGDGLASARILAEKHYCVSVIFFGNPDKASSDCKANIQKFITFFPKRFNLLKKNGQLSDLPKENIVIDAILGSGLSKPLEGRLEEIVNTINTLPNKVISIDIPTGLFASKSTKSSAIRADHVLSLEFPKLAFLMPENSHIVKKWDFRSIGLLQEGIENMDCGNLYLTLNTIKHLLEPRPHFSHKGDYGKIQIVAGQYGFAGAAVLCALGCMKSGAGLTYIHTPGHCLPVIQTSVPEAVCYSDQDDHNISIVAHNSDVDVIACGPGIGMSAKTAKALKQVLEEVEGWQKLVLDADALNIVAEKKWLDLLPPQTIITPHPGEFSRLFGMGKSDFETLEIQREASVKHQLIILYKGAYSRVSTPSGEVFFNPTGNPGMATAGSGDVLTGVIAAMAGRGMNPSEATVTGMFIHGLAGDTAAGKIGQDGMIARDIANFLPDAMRFAQS